MGIFSDIGTSLIIIMVQAMSLMTSPIMTVIDVIQHPDASFTTDLNVGVMPKCPAIPVVAQKRVKVKRLGLSAQGLHVVSV